MTNGKYENRYRIASARATWWSYDWAGAYFIKIFVMMRNINVSMITWKTIRNDGQTIVFSHPADTEYKIFTLQQIPPSKKTITQLLQSQ
ncbi:MAG TPA: hypothetical protein VHO70_15390 [Chitinispirillaceae bacterium]|nr:hypothetical protein [Chitinispirillaceae bacterium]